MEIAEVKAAVDDMADAANKRFDDLDKKLAAEKERADQLETALSRSALGELDENKGPTIEQKAFGSYLRVGAEALPELERKTLTVGTNTDGGYLVTSQFEHEILKNIVEFSPVRQAARVGQMNSSEIIIPRRTGRPTAYWVGELESRTGTQSSYGRITIPANEMAAFIDCSVQLLEDSAFDVANEIGMDLAEEFGRLEGVSFLSGNSIKKPEGVLANSDVIQAASGSASTVTADALIDMLYALPAFYRSQSTWMMNGTSLATIRKIKDGQGQYLWQPGLAAGQPETILGRPVTEAVDMPDIASGTYPIIVGSFKQGYRIYDRVGMSILRDPYTLATEGQVRFHARRRVGATVAKAEAFRKMKIATSV